MITRPKETLKDISENKPIVQSLILLVILGLMPFMMFINNDILFNAADLNPMEMEMFQRIMPAFFIFFVFGAMLLAPIFQFISTGIYNLLSEFFGYEGNGKGLFATLVFASVPNIFANIFSVILAYSGAISFSWLLTLPFTIWVIVLKIFAIRENYSMSGGKATLVYFIPVIVIFVLFIIAMILMFTTIASQMGPWMNEFGTTM
ncbi:MAG: YIP1 family protein [Firmicutes bacterium]|nr:YIP1 family protein [Bacillota bacterium]